MVRSLVVEGEAREKRTSEEAVVVEGMTKTEEGEAEGRRRWGEVGEAALLLLQHCRWPRRNRATPFSLGVSGNPGTEWHCPVAAALHGVCPLTRRRSSCDH